MAPHIVTWELDRDKRSTSPVPSTVGSVVSIESIISDMSMISHSVPDVRGRSMDFMQRKVTMPPGVHPAIDSPFVRHEKYFFQDGNITFLVRNCSTIDTRATHKVHNYFRLMALSTVSIVTSSPATQNISLPGLSSSVSVSTRSFPSLYPWEMSNARTLRPSFLSYIPSEFHRPFLFLVIEVCLSISDFEGHDLSYEQWKSVLRLS